MSVVTVVLLGGGGGRGKGRDLRPTDRKKDVVITREIKDPPDKVNSVRVSLAFRRILWPLTARENDLGSS